METTIIEKFTYEGENKEASKMESNDGRWYEKKFDSEGREIFYKDSRGLEKLTFYDEKGRIIKEQDSKGNSIEYTYDDKGRVIEIKYTIFRNSLLNLSSDELLNFYSKL